ncbi:MAG: GDP-L-fucose synthase [Elusimicrobiota bacterium]|jgi:GDP-L-fucose synthase|nr:GDP-L-fucose synthase [Elusimicrobiota bacterium]
MEKNAKIFIAGHKGLVGSAILRKLTQAGFTNLLLRSKFELNLINQEQTNLFFKKEKPDYVFLAAAKVGGIMANQSYPAEFAYNNLMIACNVINASYNSGVKKLLNLGSSCIYPSQAPQPMKEEYLLTGEFEKTNEAYAIAKFAALKLCSYYNQQYGTNFVSVLPTNIYCAGDNFNMQTAHALPTALRRFHLAKLLNKKDWKTIKSDLQKYKLGFGLDENIDFNDNVSIEKALNSVGAYNDKVVLWGDGSAYREWMSCDDLAAACLYIMQNKNYKDIGETINITSGTDIELKDLFKMIKEIVGFEGYIEYDKTKPNGMRRKLMDAKRISAFGWQPKIGLKEGIIACYQSYLNVINK